VRLLLDECVPRKFKDALPGHDASTAQEMGWSGKRNGEILCLMREHRSQRHRRFVLAARTNRLKDLLPLAPAVLKRLSQIRLGSLERVGA